MRSPSPSGAGSVGRCRAGGRLALRMQRAAAGVQVRIARVQGVARDAVEPVFDLVAGVVADQLPGVGDVVVALVVVAVDDGVPIGVAIQPVEGGFVGDVFGVGGVEGAANLVPVADPVAVHVEFVVGQAGAAGAQQAAAVGVQPGLAAGDRQETLGGLVAIAVGGELAVDQHVRVVTDPRRVLLELGEAVAVVVGAGVAAVERVGVGPFARVGQRAGVEVERRVVLVAVLHAVAVAVGVAGVGFDLFLEIVGHQ